MAPDVPAKTLTETIVERIRDAIVDGAVQPGQKLPSESALVQEYSVSRTVVREAISRLAAAGLVETYRGRGSYVLTRPTPEEFHLATASVTTLAERLELLDFRIGCETETAILAASRADEQQRQSIAEALSRFRAAAGNPHRLIEADYGFHLAIAAASNNRHYLALLRSLGQTMIAMPRTRLEVGDTESSDVTAVRALAEHEAIRAAIDSHDAVAAGAAMRTHLTNSRDRLSRGPR